MHTQALRSFSTACNCVCAAYRCHTVRHPTLSALLLVATRPRIPVLRVCRQPIRNPHVSMLTTTYLAVLLLLLLLLTGVAPCGTFQ